MADRVRYKLPFVPGVLEDDFFCGLNGTHYLIKRGEYVEIPQEIVDIIEQTEALEREAVQTSARLQREAKEKAKALS